MLPHRIARFCSLRYNYITKTIKIKWGIIVDYKLKIEDYKEKLVNEIRNLDTELINDFINLLVAKRDERKQIFIMGNGGSGATASHIAGDFNKGLSLFKPEDKRYRMVCLTDNIPALLSIANDVSYDDIFVEQIKNFLNDGDILICISGSGNSANVLKAAEYAKGRGNTIVGFTGFDGGKLKAMSDVSIYIPIDDMQITEDIHMMLGHLISSVLYHSDC